MTPEEHQEEFFHQARKLGFEVPALSIEEIVRHLICAPLDAIQTMNFCGAPCSPSELIPDDKLATMQHARRAKPNSWLRSQTISSSTYDGSISYIVAKGQERTNLGRIFMAVCLANLKNPQLLLNSYEINGKDDDDLALQKICQVVTDIGFYGAAVSSLLGAAEGTETGSYLCYVILEIHFLGYLKKIALQRIPRILYHFLAHMTMWCLKTKAKNGDEASSIIAIRENSAVQPGK